MIGGFMSSIIEFDKQIFSWFNSLAGTSQVLDFILKIISVYTIYLVPILFLAFWFIYRNEKTQKFLLEICITSIISWQVIASVIGALINRPRPSTFLGTKEIFFHPPTYSFPSDHALFLAFLTSYLYLSGYRKMGNIALGVTILVSISRVVAGLHWPGDILAGWILGILLALMFFEFKKYIIKYIVNPLYYLAKLIRLV